MKRRVPLDIEFLLEGILSESPDEVRSSDHVCDWTDDDAMSFMIFDTFSVMAPKRPHYTIMSNLHRVYESITGGKAILKLLEDTGKFYVSDIDAAVIEIKSKESALGKYFKRYGQYENDMMYRTKLGLTGRLWMDVKVISFWNKSTDVATKMPQLEKMFVRFAKQLGKLDDYRVDFLERGSDRKTTLPLISSIRSSSDPEQTDFMQNLFGGNAAKLSDDQIKQLQKKIHTLPPEKKKQVFDMLGVKNFKASEIAAKLGISVAEFNHIMQVNEDEFPSLTEIIREIRNKKI
jgi:hypothetical protein